MTKVTRETLREMIAEEIARDSKTEPEAVKVTPDQLRSIILQEVSKISEEVIEEQDAKKEEPSKEEPSKEDLELMKKLYDKLGPVDLSDMLKKRGMLREEEDSSVDMSSKAKAERFEKLSNEEKAKVLRWFVDVGMDKNFTEKDKQLVVKYSPEMMALSSAEAPKGVSDVLDALKNAKGAVGLGDVPVLAGRPLDTRDLGEDLPELPDVEKPKVSTKMMKMKARGPVKINI
jgi:hypothetical protein